MCTFPMPYHINRQGVGFAQKRLPVGTVPHFALLKIGGSVDPTQSRWNRLPYPFGVVSASPGISEYSSLWCETECGSC